MKGVGRSQGTFKKHVLIRTACEGQVFAFLVKHPESNILLIDGNAGDGLGAKRPQGSFFDDNASIPTSEILVRLAKKIKDRCGRVNVLLCERKPEARVSLERRFSGVPNVMILKNHDKAPRYIRGCDYVLWISDPNGPSDQGVEAMRACANIQPKTDFVIVFNKHSLHAICGTDKARKASNGYHEKYSWMYNWEDGMPARSEWCRRLGKKKFACTRSILGGGRFYYHILVVTNHLSKLSRDFVPLEAS